jgi:mono/diheme cytochrome c family protein
MIRFSRFALLAGLALAASPAFAQQSGQASPAGDAKQGEKLYMTVGCQECHGRVAQGSVFSGPRLAPGPVPFQAFVHQLRQPQSEMPPYEPVVLSDKDAADIYAFLGTIPKPPDPKSIPLLNGG